jgi:hypothetical protein
MAAKAKTISQPAPAPVAKEQAGNLVISMSQLEAMSDEDKQAFREAGGTVSNQ